jgi:hypothetical protein
MLDSQWVLLVLLAGFAAHALVLFAAHRRLQAAATTDATATDSATVVDGTVDCPDCGTANDADYLIQRESPALTVRRECSDHSRNRTPNRALTNRSAICSHTRNRRFLGTGVNRVRSTESSTAPLLLLSLQRR